MKNKISQIQKRDGRIVDFDKSRITSAIFKAMKATKSGSQKIAQKLSDEVVDILNKRFAKKETPSVENIQDIVEEVLIENDYAETAKAYILYRDQRRKIRETQKPVDLMDDYLKDIDWEVHENSNMSYSLQGLNNHIASLMSRDYWLEKIYPPEIREAHQENDFHLHNLQILAVYCCGWDLQDLLQRGFGGVFGKIEASPPKHFRTALGQIVNFFYTTQGEVAGAGAFSSFDTLLAPFVRKDGLRYSEVKQALQEFLYNMNVPTRVGFQCISEDTEILTPEGWKGYQEVKKGSLIRTFNLKTRKIENKEVTYLFKKKYKGLMYRLENRIQDQLISPKHRVVRKKFNSDTYLLEPIEDIIKLKSPFVIPVAADNSDPEANISDEQIKLMAWIISEGTIERPTKHRCCYRVSIYQSKSKNRKNYQEIISLLKHFKLKYSEDFTASLGEDVQRMRIDAESSRKIHKWFGTKENVHFIPDHLLNLSERQSRLFLETYLRADGFEGCKISTTDLDLLDSLQIIIVNSGYGFTVLKRKPIIGKKDIYVLRIIRHRETYISKIKKVNYQGVIWSPHTENETVIARRNGKVFITGNTPFTNLTMDLTPPRALAEQNVIISGETLKEKYGDFQEEMDMINRAFAEMMIKGDSKGRVFTFPIPTYNITPDFNWDDPNLELVWEMTAKYGIPYFANFINSDMNSEDIRSMCCRLRLDNRELYKRGGGLFGSYPLTGCYDEKTEILTENGWKFFKDLAKNEKVLTLTRNNRIELHKPRKFFKYDYDGQMYQFKTKSLDLLVTPNHRMVVDDVWSKKRKFVEAKDFQSNTHRIPKQSIWSGEEKEWFILPGIEFTKYGRQGKTPYQIIRDSLKIRMDNWLKFFGFWLAEGCTDNERIAKNHGYRVIITQVDKKKRKEIRKVLDSLPFNYYPEGNNFIICNKQLWSYLRQFGNKYEKFIPKEIKNLSKRQLKILFDWMVEGDGHIRKTTGQINYWTSSKKLADDLQEIILKLGWLGTLNIQKKKVSQIKGRKIKAGICYTIGVQKAKYYRLRKDNVKKVRYQGKVYCCEVKNHTVFIRRNGKVSWCGNSIGVVTLNMSRIGYLSKTKKEFLERVERLMGLAREALEIKRKTLERFTEQGLYPYAKHYLDGIKKLRGQYWANHFATIGLVGMNEALINFMKENIASTRGRKFALEVLNFMRKILVKYQEETGNIYNLEATPAEGTSYRLAKSDKEKYPDIVVANEEAWQKDKAAPYYTNSTQLPVGHTDDVFEALNLQNDLQARYTGGTVLHGFLGERVADGQTAKMLVKKVFEKYQLPYFTLTPTFSVCPHHGYISGEHFHCPKCVIKQPCEVYSRIVGYLRPVQQWNEGKKSEFSQRKEFKIKKPRRKTARAK